MQVKPVSNGMQSDTDLCSGVAGLDINKNKHKHEPSTRPRAVLVRRLAMTRSAAACTLCHANMMCDWATG
jgi:hypothetical protein